MYVICEAELRFEWDSKRASENRRKHGVSFEEAVSVFADELAILIADPDHSASEQRHVLLGLSAKVRVLVVTHCYRKADEVVRLISARKATRKERGIYSQGWGK